MAWLLPLSLLISGGFGYWIAGRALQSIRSMTTEVRRISPQDLHTRVSIPVAKGELRDLAQTMNELLNRIERAFVAQERFVADASHQLQTPLALIRAEIESEAFKSQLLSSSLRSVLQEVEHMSRLIKDLLMLARAEAGGGSLAFQNFFLDEIVLETLSRLDSVFKRKSIRLMFNIQENNLPRQSIQGDPELMSTLIYSLLENAAKYSPTNGQVSCTLEIRSTSQKLIVRDEGPGISASELNQVFDRFHRGSAQQEPGHGLGLAIAKKVADAHRAKLWVENRETRGAAFHFEMPLPEASDSQPIPSDS
ncbi:MAG: HAMP domain-containing sensor histidine kinase [Bdellovibrio sp.]